MISVGSLLSLRSGLRSVRQSYGHSAYGETIREKQDGLAALDLACRLAEAAAKDPAGLAKWFDRVMSARAI
jgi:hypothetical protein